MTTKLYLANRSLTALALVEAVQGGDTPTVALSQTIFHPQGGGQKADTGALHFETGARLADYAGEAYFSEIEHDQVRVTDVRHGQDGASVVHQVDDVSRLSPGMTVLLSVDAERRRRNSLLHSAGHLLAGLVEEMSPDLKAGAGRHWPGEAWVEFDGQVDDLPQFELQLDAAIRLAITRSLPITIDAWADGGRHVAIGGAMRLRCGGTHIENTSELAGFRLKTARSSQGVLRVSYDIEAAA